VYIKKNSGKITHLGLGNWYTPFMVRLLGIIEIIRKLTCPFYAKNYNFGKMEIRTFKVLT